MNNNHEMDFELIADPKNPLWVDVKYPNEDKPRYMIDLINYSCTCMGGTFGLVCKHIKKWRSKK